MKYGKRLILQIPLFFSLSLSSISAQQFDVERAIEALFSLPDENINYEEFYERYFLLFEKPLDLNRANYSELKSLHAFSEREISQIINYRDSVGQVLSLYELAYLPPIDIDKLKALAPFLTTQSTMEATNLKAALVSQENAYLITRFERRIEKAAGYTNNRFAGDRNRLYIRYRNSVSNTMSYGLTLEKDAGEAFVFDQDTYRFGMDFWSAHVMIQNQKRLKKVIIGDYQLQFGQGLIFNSGIGIGKGAETINTLEKVYQGARPYTSVIEGGFLRGIAATYSLRPQWNLTGFLSSLRQDASLRVLDINDDQLVFSGFQNTGLHRTQSEIENKNRVRELLAGFNLNLSTRSSGHIGITFSNSQFSSPINRGSNPQDLFEFRGSNNLNFGLYGNTRLKQFRLFGEAAISKNGALGLLMGLQGNLAPRLELALLARLYDKAFHSLRSGAFGEGSRNINEEGVYLGLKYTLNRQLNIRLYYDQFRFKWMRFRANRPGNGYDMLFRINYSPHQNTHFYLQFRKERKDRNFILENQLVVRAGTSKRFILHFDFIPTHFLNLRSKIQWSDYEIAGNRNSGLAFFQDINLAHNRFIINLRFSIFDTEGGDNRQYAYEQDLLYNFSIPGLSGKGIRNYGLIKYQITKKLNMGIKLSRTAFFDRNTIGTGVDQIMGNRITDLKAQTVYRF